MGNETMLTLDLPPQIIQGIDNMPVSVRKTGHRSRVCRFLLQESLKRYIDLATLEITTPLMLEQGMTYAYPSRIGFMVSANINAALEKLCCVYPFSKKSLAEFLLCQMYMAQSWQKEYGEERKA